MKKSLLTTICCAVVPLVCFVITGIILFLAIYNSLELWEDIGPAVERIYNICGYKVEEHKADIIMYQTNPCDSVIMLKDNRSTETISKQMNTLLEEDARWSKVNIPPTRGICHNSCIFLGWFRCRHAFPTGLRD